jgi:serine/threonine protein kinase
MMGTISPVEAAQNFGKYTIIEMIGEGHLGPVYRGFDQDLGSPVVIRVLCDGIKWDPKLEETFEHEIRAVSNLQHPNIARIFDIGREGPHRYIVMESLGSGTLENLTARNSAVPVETKLSIMIQVAEGLGYAHKHGILHRHLEPGKIHLTPDGTVKIRDFAIAPILMKYLPHPAVRWGVPIYLCPEQIQQNDCDERSDIFSAGTIFYELINHFHPFYDRDSNKALDNILSDAQIPTFERFPSAPPGIWTILRSCLARSPEDRYRNTEELSIACRDLIKNLAEDNQLMLAELYAAISPLRKAAAQSNASENSLRLLDEIQKLLRGERQPEYTHLDQLMTILMEEYPAIQAVADALPEIGSICPHIPPENEEVPNSAEAPEVPAQNDLSAKTQEPPPLPATPDVAPLEKVAPPREQLSGDESLQPVQQEPGETEGAKEAVPPAIPVIEAQPCQSVEKEPQPTVEVEQNAGDAPPKPAQTPVPAPPVVERITKETPGKIHPRMPEVMPEKAAVAFSAPAESKSPEQQPARSIYRRIRKPTYRTAAILLSLLVMAAAGYIFVGAGAAHSIQRAWNNYMPSGGIMHVFAQQSQTSAPAQTSAPTTTAGAKVEVPKEMNPQENPTPITAAQQVDTSASGRDRATAGDPAVGAAVARIAGMLNTGKLVQAKAEIDRLQQLHPEAPEISGLRRKLQALLLKQSQDQTRREEDQQKATAKQKEDEWNRQVSDCIARGKYNEAAAVLTLWLSENPANPRAQELNSRVQEILRQLKAYSSAISEARYHDALSALASAEKMNPADPGFAEMRHQAEAKRAAARAVLTVYRLGPKFTVLLDGKPIGKDGEVENESIAIGNHTLTIENGGTLIASRIQEYFEGQRVVLVYDPAKQSVRPMIEADREQLAQRKALEEAEQFSLEHDHGVFRGSCRGVLTLDSLDVAYSPSSGAHGFRIPFKLLKLKVDGKSVSLYYVSDNTHFQTFRFPDSVAAFKFKQKWDGLKFLIR